MISLIAARIPSGRPKADVCHVMTMHDIDFCMTTNIEDLIAYLRSSVSHEEGVAKNPLPTNSIDQVNSNAFPSRTLDPTATPDLHQMNSQTGNIRSAHVPFETAVVHHEEPVDVFDRQAEQEVAEAAEAALILQSKSADVGITEVPVPSGIAVVRHVEPMDIYDRQVKAEAAETAPVLQNKSADMGNTEVSSNAFPSKTLDLTPGLHQMSSQIGNIRSVNLESAVVRHEEPVDFDRQVKKEVAEASEAPLVLQNESADMGITENWPIPLNDSYDYGQNMENLGSVNHNVFQSNWIPADADFRQIDFEVAPIDVNNSAEDLAAHNFDQLQEFAEERVVKKEIKECSTDEQPPLLSAVVPIANEVPQETTKKLKYGLRRRSLPDTNDTEVDMTEDVDEMDDSSDSEERLDSVDVEYTPRRVFVSTKSKVVSAKNKKKHKCTVCSKAFPFRSNLKLHYRTHTGEKPFECSVCQKKFSEKGNLDTHMRIHTGEKPFVCDVCGKKCKQRIHLVKHKKSHKGAK